MLFVLASILFLSLYNCGGAIFRSIKKTAIPMRIILSMNVLNVAGNAVMVYGLKSSVEGVAIPTLISRIGAAVPPPDFRVQAPPCFFHASKRRDIFISLAGAR